MKTIGHLLVLTFALMPWCLAPLLSQQTITPEEKTITITKHTKDADGTQSSETIVKKGKAAKNFDVEKYLSENRADNVQIEVRVETIGDDEQSVIVKRSGYDKSRIDNNTTTSDSRAFLGVEEDSDEDPNQPGLVVDIVRGSAADLAGLRDNDMILKLNETPLNRWSDLSAFMKNIKPGDKIKITYRRNGKDATTEALLTTRKEVKKPTTSEPKGFLGVSPKGNDDKAPGVTITVTKNSGAEKAGLKNGDTIFQLDDTTIADFEDISDFMRYTKPGDVLQVVYERNGQRSTTEVTLGEQKTWDWSSWNMGEFNLDNLAIDVREKDACIGVYSSAATMNDQRGAKITSFTKESAAREAQMLPGDLITHLNGQSVQGQDDLWKEIAKYKVGDKVSVEYLRNNQTTNVEVTLKACRDQSRVEIWETDENGDNQSRSFFTWNWDQEEQKRLRENRIITIRRPEEDGDASKTNAAPDNQTIAQDRSLKLDSFRAYPNPTQGQVMVQFKAEPIATIVTLYDMSGRQVFREELNYFSGDYNQQFDLSDYAKGTVIVHVQQSEKVFTSQIVVN